MSRSSRSDRRAARGFSLAEAVVSLVILVVVMTIALTLLFSMKSFAERQQANVVPRQAARRAIDYLSYYAAGASDLYGDIWVPGAIPNPNAVPVWYSFGNNVSSAASPRQAAYNGLTGAQSALGTPGTDVLSLAIPVSPLRLPVTEWIAGVSDGDIYLDYSVGCASNDATNLQLFCQATGGSDCSSTGIGSARSGLLLFADTQGRWRYGQITGYVSSDCSAAGKRIVRANIIAGDQNQVNPPGGYRDDLAAPVTLVAGVEYVSFRHRVVNNVPSLQQKSTVLDSGTWRFGLFDATTDDGGSNDRFVSVVENVEDFQVAYVFRDGQIWNTETQVLPSGQSGVPLQARSNTVNCAATPTDVLCAVGLRITVVGRSLPLNLGSRNLTDWNLRLRPRAEDRAGATSPDTLAGGIFDRYRQTVTLMLRNRFLEEG